MAAMTVQQATNIMAQHADQIAALFTDARVTIYVRCLGVKDADLLVSPDDANTIVAGILRLSGQLQ